jgi:phosphoenolpyruvate-protein kinase (PTS system EI component)
LVGLCGQAPSDKPEFARFLVEQGIDSISLTPDSVLGIIQVVADAEKDFEIERELNELEQEIQAEIDIDKTTEEIWKRSSMTA